MSKHSLAGRSNSSDRRAIDHHPAAGTAATLVPPAYGIDFVDSTAYSAVPVQRLPKPEEEKKRKPVQGKFDAPAAQGPQVPGSPSPNRTGLPDGLKAGIESLSGMDLSDVRVNFNSDKPARVSAHAYAQGSQIHLGPGQERHLAHEAWHVVQQKQGRVRPTMQLKTGVSINDDASLEREADAVGARAASIMSPGATFLGEQSIPIQRYKWTYGALQDESGTEVKTDLIAPNDTGGGSGVSAWPSWWPSGAAETANDFLRENFVQGHLLNQKLGGPGDNRRNLTPLTRSANSQMSASIENVAKSYLSSGDAIKYWVTADYSYHPNAKDVGAGHLKGTEKTNLQDALDKMPGEVGSQITAYEYDMTSGDWEEAAKQPDDVYVKNEGAALKGSFV
jgi:hypothetical protein